MLKGENTLLCQSAANTKYISDWLRKTERVENPSSFCQPLFRRQQFSYNSRQTTRRDNNLLFEKMAVMIA
jgi:hypothetical protein